MISADAVPRRRLGIRIRRFRGEILVSTGEESFELAGSGAFIFEAIDQRSTVGSIAARVARQYSLRDTDALADTESFLAELIDGGIIELARVPVRRDAGAANQA